MPRRSTFVAFAFVGVVACGLDSSGSFTPAGPGSDGGIADSGPVADPIDASTDTGPSSFCATAGPHFFCADFDEGNFPPPGSTAAITGGDAHIDGMFSESAPFSFFSQISAVADASARFVVSTPLGNTTQVTLAFKVHIDGEGDPAGGGPQLFTIQATDSSQYGVRILVGPNATLVGNMTASPVAVSANLGAFTVGSWIPISVVISPNSQVVFIVDGKTTPVAFTVALPDPLLLKLGEYGQKLDAPAMHFDDVTLDL